MQQVLTQTLSVSQALKLCNSLFNDVELIVEGEVAQFGVSRGTYVFFDLKDENEEARAGCFMMAFQLTVPLENGMRVQVVAKPGIYTKSGSFRLTVRKVLPLGEGSLKRAFELLKAKLEQEGLFAPGRKRALPRYPARVGVIASTESAGYGDFKRIVSARLPGLALTVTHVAVQGKDAEQEICSAFDYLNSYYDLDCIVLIRGGGSLEDLHAFNSEPVARAIVRSKAPVIVGVGHERDVTIADFCADVRASTPSNAAQLLVPMKEEVVRHVESLLSKGHHRVSSYIQLHKEKVVAKASAIHQKAIHAIQLQEQTVKTKLETITALSPHRTLERGYSITTTKDGKLVRSRHDVAANTEIVTILSDGQITSVTSL